MIAFSKRFKNVQRTWERHSFLFDWQQCTTVSRLSSFFQKLHVGVPQGAILSILLFSLFMNDLVKSTSGKKNLFADDTSAYVTATLIFALQEKLQDNKRIS